MPRIPKQHLDCVFYLFNSPDDAQNGCNVGGTGFVACIKSEKFPEYYLPLFVTNWHNACKAGASVVRLHKKDGKTVIFDFDPADWIFDPQFDVAVIPANIDVSDFRVSVLDLSSVDKGSFDDAEIGPGDDVYMIGRFIDHDGGVETMPSARFGNVSMNPTMLTQPNGKKALSYCIDLHSRSGYSGSPVFVYRTPGWNLESHLRDNIDKRVLLHGTNLLLPLGIHWGQFPELWEIDDRNELKSESREPLLTGKKFVKGLSGMTCVLPMWIVKEVLMHPKIQEARKILDQNLLNSDAASEPQAETFLPPNLPREDDILRTMLNTPPKPKD